MCGILYHGQERSDYVPAGIGLGNDEDYVEFSYCADCGQMQGEFPIPEQKLKEAIPSNY
jgi:hypothetical protein